MPIRVVAGVSAETAGPLQRYLESQPDLELAGLFSNGLRVVEAVPQTEADVLVLDLILPGIDGLGVLERLRGLGSGPQVILLSSIARTEMIQRALGAGAAYYLLKPFDIAQLGARIRQFARPLASTPAPFSADVEGELTRLIMRLGIPAKIKGYRYLRQAVVMVTDRVDLLRAITTEVYPAVARANNDTAPCVERAIRHAIEVAFRRANPADLIDICGNLSHRLGRPANGEFIALLADHLRRCGGRLPHSRALTPQRKPDARHGPVESPPTRIATP